MNESPTGTSSGRRVYADLLRAQNSGHKYVYVLASHSHYYMDGIFNTDYWKKNGGVLPGWIVEPRERCAMCCRPALPMRTAH